MTGRRALIGLGIAAALALPIAGCGKDKPKIPRDNARALVALLGTVQRQSDAHACVTVERTISSLQTRVEALPSKTDPDIRASLRDGIAHLRTLVTAECATQKPKPKDQTTTTDTQSTDTTTGTTTDTTTGTSTSTSTDTSTQTTPTTPSTQTTPSTPPSGGTPSDQGHGGGKAKGKKK
jgi:hypothetical protein